MLPTSERWRTKALRRMVVLLHSMVDGVLCRTLANSLCGK